MCVRVNACTCVFVYVYICVHGCMQVSKLSSGGTGDALCALAINDVVSVDGRGLFFIHLDKHKKSL